MHRKTAILLLVFIIAAAASACSVPVFRYALEKWEPSNYRLFIVFAGKPSVSDNELLVLLKDRIAGRKTARANIMFETVDLSGELDEETRASLTEAKGRKPPYILVLFPSVEYEGSALKTEEKAAFICFFERQSLEMIFSSPVRDELAKDLSGEVSVDWLFLESGDASADKEAFETLSSAIKKAEKSIVLPEPSEADYAEVRKAPSKVNFKIIRVKKNDPREVFLVSSLLGFSGIKLETGPAVFAVYGKGRAFMCLQGELLNTRNIISAAGYLCGPCSCQIKEQNPGIDLLLSADWESMINRTVTAEAETLPLAGIFPSETAPGKTTIMPEAVSRAGAKKEKPRQGILNSAIKTAVGVILALSVVFAGLARGRKVKKPRGRTKRKKT
ncbi:MAG: hypothetical protein WCI43_07160 [Candidatus Firestonebacteria bacterium]